MPKLYGNPQKFIRHVTDQSYVIEPQRMMAIPFWYCDTSATARTDGQDLADEFKMPIGSKILKHKVEVLVTPTTIEPQRLYIGRLKLSFHDILAQPICGTSMDQTGFQSAVTGAGVTSHLKMWPNVSIQRARHNTGQIDTSGYDTIQLHDLTKHFINFKKAIVFDQRPLIGERWQRIPAKVKRINPYTWYGMYVFNDSPRGATPADTQVTFQVKQYIEEKAL